MRRRVIAGGRTRPCVCSEPELSRATFHLRLLDRPQRPRAQKPAVSFR
jgi:hypothetical protein